MKEYDFYVVPTPIGNLGDITLRAIDVLNSVDLIACEDSRVTQNLLNHFNIKTKCLSYHKYNEKERISQIVEFFSAGGPIISPKVDCMVLTPICAHSLQHRPTVVQGSAQIRLLLGSDAPQSACLQVDGQTYAQLDDGAVVEISRADRTLQLIRTSDQPFFNLVREKLTEWTR